MSSYWRLSRHIEIRAIERELEWPAQLSLHLELDPYDFFEGTSDGRPDTVMFGPVKLEIDTNRGTLKTVTQTPAEPVSVDINIAEGVIQVRGHIAHVIGNVKSFFHLTNLFDWLYTSFSNMLSLRLGVFTRVTKIYGSVGGFPITAFYPGGSYSLLYATVKAEDRPDIIVDALEMANPNAPSFPRFSLCTYYYRHALRLLSPREVSSPPYTVFSEVLLNLAKCIEQMFSSSDQKYLRLQFAKVGYTSEQVEAHLIPILIIRNKIDVGHTLDGIANDEDITVLRKFVVRSIKNVGALLHAVLDKIRTQEDFLEPLETSNKSKRSELIESIKSYLEKDQLEPRSTTQRIVSIEQFWLNGPSQSPS